MTRRLERVDAVVLKRHILEETCEIFSRKREDLNWVRRLTVHRHPRIVRIPEAKHSQTLTPSESPGLANRAGEGGETPSPSLVLDD